MSDDERRFFERMTARLDSPEILARKKADEAERDLVIAGIAERLLGVRPEHADPIYTQYPVMAGVLRQALKEAYEAGTTLVATRILTSMVDGIKKRGE